MNAYGRAPLALAGVLLLTGVAAGLQSSPTSPSEGTTAVELLRLVFTGTSVLASILLVYLYFQQKNVAETEHRADVQLEGYAADRNDLEICLTNLGRGPATDLSIEFDAEALDCDGIAVFDPQSKPLIKRLSSEIENEWVRPNRNYLSAQSQYTTFWTPIQLYDSAAGRPVTPTYLSGDTNSPVERLRLRGTLHYEDRLGNEYEQELLDFVIPLVEEGTLEELLPYGMKHDAYKRRVENGDADFGPNSPRREYLR